jgi:hypothetical protein
MRKLFLLALASVIWLGSWPRPASAGCGDQAPNKIIARPSYTALVQGKLEELPLMRCPRPAPWMLYADGQQIYVDFGTNAELLAKAKKLHKTLVEISGTLEDTGHYEKIPHPLWRAGCDIGPIRSRVRILHVTSLTALGDPDGTPVEITGELHVVVLESYPPIIRWTFRADNANYTLRFNSAALADKVWRLRGQSVTVIGRLGNENAITVTGLVHAETPRTLLPSFPEEIPPYIFKPVITK